MTATDTNVPAITQCYIVANWKMSLTAAESRQLALELRREADRILLPPDLVTWIAPSFLAIPEVARQLTGSRFSVGGQNLWHESKGAYTGEVSGGQLREAGATFVIVGHSERRQLLGETNELIRRKTEAALRSGLQVILCIGETREEREAGRTMEVLQKQLSVALTGRTVHEMERLIVAYEPVWAIGTGLVASTKQIDEAHSFCADQIFHLTHAACPLLYGGSMNPENATNILSLSSVHGGLVGGASLKADSFIALIKAGLESL